MSDLEKIRNWLKSYPGKLPVQKLRVDYFSERPDDGSIDPSGLIKVSRTTDIMGNITVENQLNFALYFTLLKSPEDDQGAAENADLLLNLQQWIQDQSLRRKTPNFGDDPGAVEIKAQNGALHLSDEQGVGIYTVQLSVNFIKYYEVN
jgi:hypothetical protein